MGACMSINSDQLEQKKRSQAIDRELMAESRQLRRECKILLLGKTASHLSPGPARACVLVSTGRQHLVPVTLLPLPGFCR